MVTTSSDKGEMRRRNFIAGSVLAGAGLACAPEALWGQEPAAKPNVVVFCGDDISAGDIGCFGNADVLTPNLDRLAGQGVRFTNAHCQSPLCNPSRTSFLSGLRPETTGVVDNRVPPNHYIENLQFMHRYFNRGGYYTAGIGKMAQMRFHVQFSGRGLDDSLPVGPQRNRKRIEPHAEKVGEHPDHYYVYTGPENLLPDQTKVNAARTRLRKLATSRQPFYMHIGFQAAHKHVYTPEQYWDRYAREELSVPAFPTDKQKKELATSLGRDNRGDIDARYMRRTLHGYYASITHLDQLIGEVLEELKTQGLWDNTIVVFITDHGQSINPWNPGKGNVLREGSHVPLIIRDPRTGNAGRTCSRVVEYIDLLPTLLDLCGLPEEPVLDGRSLVPLLSEPDREWDHFAQITHLRGRNVGRGIVKGDYHYVKWESPNYPPKLYNYTNDPQCYENLADQPDYARVLKELDACIVTGDIQLTRKPEGLK